MWLLKRVIYFRFKEGQDRTLLQKTALLEHKIKVKTHKAVSTMKFHKVWLR